MSIPSQPPEHDPIEEPRNRTWLQRRRQRAEPLSTHVFSAASRGERMLPYLFAVMEACWVDILLIGLASTGMLPGRALLFPLWAPPVLMLISIWFSNYLERRDSASANVGEEVTVSSGSSLMYVIVVVIALFIVWSSLYAGHKAIVDLGWLGMLFSDTFALSGATFRIVVIALLTIYFCWRGTRLARRSIEPADVIIALRIGLSVIVVATLARVAYSVPFFDESILLLLIPVFLSLVLITHAFAKTLFVRRSHERGLQGGVGAQESTLFLISGLIALLILLFTFTVGMFTSASFLADVQRVLAPIGALYDLATRSLAYLLVLMLTPVFLLLQWLHFTTPTLKQQKLPPGVHGSTKPAPPPQAVVLTATIVEVLVPLLIAALVIILIRMALRRRRVVRKRYHDEEYESLWSWQLFWTQVKAILLAWWRRLFPQQQAKATLAGEESITGPVGARTVREIYRALLIWAAARGIARKRDETPNELKQRLDEHMPEIEVELDTVTSAYNATRYGELVPDEAEIAHVQQAWVNLQQRGQA